MYDYTYSSICGFRKWVLVNYGSPFRSYDSVFHDNNIFYATHGYDCWWKVGMAIVHKSLKTVTKVLRIYYTLV